MAGCPMDQAPAVDKAPHSFTNGKSFHLVLIMILSGDGQQFNPSAHAFARAGEVLP